MVGDGGVMYNMFNLFSIVSNSAPHMNCVIAIGCLITLACVPLYSLDRNWIDSFQFSLVCQVSGQ